MTLMYRNVRVSVRPLTQATDSTWGTPTETFAHDRFQTLFSLGPMSGSAILSAQREGFYADWEAVAARLPAIPDGARIVTFDANDVPDLWFKVAKVLPRGMKTVLMLQEVNEEQS